MRPSVRMPRTCASCAWLACCCAGGRISVGRTCARRLTNRARRTSSGRRGTSCSTGPSLACTGRVSSLQRRSSRSRACGGSLQSVGHPGQACWGSSRRGGAGSREAPVPFPGSIDMVCQSPSAPRVCVCVQDGAAMRRTRGSAIRLDLGIGLRIIVLAAVRRNEVAVVVHATRREGSGKANESRKQHRRRLWRRRVAPAPSCRCQGRASMARSSPRTLPRPRRVRG